MCRDNLYILLKTLKRFLDTCKRAYKIYFSSVLSQTIQGQYMPSCSHKQMLSWNALLLLGTRHQYFIRLMLLIDRFNKKMYFINTNRVQYICMTFPISLTIVYNLLSKVFLRALIKLTYIDVDQRPLLFRFKFLLLLWYSEHCENRGTFLK